MKLAVLFALSLLASTLAACSAKGACVMGSTHDSCEQDRTKSYCDQGSHNEFHANATCASVGYAKESGSTWTK